MQDREFKPSVLNPILNKDENGNIRKARISSKEVAPILGYDENEINYLIREKVLVPLGVKGAKGLTKHHWKFSTYYIMKLCQDEKWLDEAERKIWEHHATTKLKQRIKKTTD